MLPSIGPLISSLVVPGVARYCGYRLVERVGLYSSGTASSGANVRLVPNRKQNMFENKNISLVGKRRLMCLTFAASEFESKPEISGKEDKSFIQYLQR
jgi:Rab proteins geranylgeranyltransferase component A